MSFLRKLGKMFSGQPFVLQIRPTSEKVHIVVNRGEQIIAHQALLKNKVLPTPLVKFLESQPEADNLGYFVTLPLAIRMIKALKQYESDSFQLDIVELSQLQKVDRPAGFQIHWQFDRTRQVLNRAILGADGYLGEGWFYRGKGVWKLQESITPTMLQWLDKTTIRENELYKFVTQVFPLFQQLGHICDLTVEPDLRLDVQVIKVLKRSADFQITSNKPALQKQLKTIRDDASNLISGDTILPGLAIKLRGKLLQLAKSGEVTRISGDELLAFLQDDLTSVASESGVDIESLRTAFPIDDAALVPATWKLEHDIKDGIGRYEIVPCVQASGELIPTATLEKAFQSGSRFLKVGERWLEFTPQFSVRYQEWRQKNLRKVRLAPQEVMGSYTDRLDRLQLVPPHIETEKAPTPETEGE
ncbi:MAG: hypothetical protein KC708_26275, partial [Anaerolineae bacterium]|nr:hypothetical protein [Anaerolineae bacterium]